MTLFSVVFAALFTYLGLWQIDRYHEKTRLLDEAQQRHNRPGVALDALPRDPAKLDGLPVSLEGQYDPEHIFLLDNRIVEGRVGFDVLVPFRVPAAGTTVLVNRGFVPMARTRRQTPDIPPVPAGELSLKGYVHVGEENSVVGDDAELVGRPPWPIIVQVSNPVLLQLELDRSLYPHVIRLAETDPNALPRNWPVTTVLPQRHMGYAIQWFAMAIAVVVAWFYFTMKTSSKEIQDDRT